MTLVELVLAIVKILFMIIVVLNYSALATWGERRQSAMVQDRVGPNRAVIHLPALVIRGVVLLPPALIAAAAGFGATRAFPGRSASEAFFLGMQGAIFLAWTGMLLLRAVAQSGAANALETALAKSDYRTIAYAGLAGHGATLLATGAVPDGAALAPKVALGLLAVVGTVVAVYSAGRIPEGPIPIRLAGTLHAIADTIKMVWKEDFVPKNADRVLHALAPILSMFPALVTCAVIPFGATLCFQDVGTPGEFDWADLGALMPAMSATGVCQGHAVTLQIADLNVGILYLFAMAGTGVIGAAIAGWASDNKFSLLGGLRAASQMVSYEVAMGLSLIGLFMTFGTVRLGQMVEWQGANTWGIFVQPLGFVLFLTALAAETKRVPFDQPEGESEIVAGYFVEYSGMKWGMFMVGEYAELVMSSVVLSTLFFGGYYMPFLHADGIRVQIGESLLWAYPMTHVAVVVTTVVLFVVKVAFVTFVQIFFRWTLPRFRYDQVMKLGWTVLLPLAIANMVVTGVLLLAYDASGPSVRSSLALVADLTQALVAFATLAGIVALVRGLLSPRQAKPLVISSASQAAADVGGTVASPQQA